MLYYIALGLTTAVLTTALILAVNSVLDAIISEEEDDEC